MFLNVNKILKNGLTQVSEYPYYNTIFEGLVLHITSTHTSNYTLIEIAIRWKWLEIFLPSYIELSNIQSDVRIFSRVVYFRHDWKIKPKSKLIVFHNCVFGFEESAYNDIYTIYKNCIFKDSKL